MAKSMYATGRGYTTKRSGKMTGGGRMSAAAKTAKCNGDPAMKRVRASGGNPMGPMGSVLSSKPKGWGN
jgi:hypothetical protein